MIATAAVGRIMLDSPMIDKYLLIDIKAYECSNNYLCKTGFICYDEYTCGKSFSCTNKYAPRSDV